MVRFAKQTLCVITSLLAFAFAASAETTLTFEAEIASRTAFKSLKSNKAMAIGPGGYWWFVSGSPSADAAKKQVLGDCKAYISRHKLKKLGECALVAINDDYVYNGRIIEPLLDSSLPLPDQPLRKAKTFPANKGKPRGLVLALHGADSSYGVSSGPIEFQRSWFDYFNSIGLLVVFPSAYDDSIQVQEYAGWYSPETHELSDRMNRIRIAQTRRTLSELKRSHPGLPIYLWSHSAGGNIVQALEGGFSGAIIVGNDCGLGEPRVNLVPASIPLMYVFGDRDDKVIKGVTRLTATKMKSRCGKAYATKNRRIVIAPNSDHLTSIWRQEVIDAAAEFFQQPKFSLKIGKSKHQPVGRAEKAFLKDYNIVPLKKAFAIGPHAFAFSASLASQADANLRAVLDCNLIASGQFYPDTGEHACGLWAEGSKTLVSP